MDALCDYPTHCPHGDPIPRKDGSLPQEQLVCILELKPGEYGVLRRVATNDARILRYLSHLHLMPGHQLRLVEMAPFNGPVTLTVTNQDSHQPITQIVGSELAEKLFVYLPEG